MGSKGRMPPHMRRPVPGPGVMHPDPYGPGMHPPPHSRLPHFDWPPPEVMEQKLAGQHMEMQLLLTENQRLATTHGTLRQELAAAQNELQMLQSQTSAVRAEKEQQVRNLTEKIERMSSELQAEEAVKADLEKARSEAQNLALARQDLMSKVQHSTLEHQRVHADVQRVPFMVQELESIRQEVQHCRATYEYEKKLYNDHLESLQVMEKNYYNMSQEVEKLRAELNASVNINKRPGGAYSSTTGYNENDASASHPSGQTSYEDSYAAQHGRVAHPVATGVGVPPSGTPSYFDGQHGPPSQRPSYGGGSFYNQQRALYDPQMQMGMYNHPQPMHPYDPHRVPPVHDPHQGLTDPKMGSNDLQRALNVPPHMQPGANPNNNAYGAPGAPPLVQPRLGNPAVSWIVSRPNLDYSYE